VFREQTGIQGATTMVETYDTGYSAGAIEGYDWLTRGTNFRHPSVQGGYIPGGPGNYYMDERHAARNLLRKGWRAGFIAGINAYVGKHGLDYPTVTG